MKKRHIEERFKRILFDLESWDQEEIDDLSVILRSHPSINKNLFNFTVNSFDGVSEKLKDILFRFIDLFSTPKICVEEIFVKSSNKIKDTKNDDVYLMASHPRGFCLIIDNHLFSCPKLHFRAGSRADAHRLSNVFNQLSFEVKYYQNQTVQQMRLLLTSLSKHEHLSDHDALAVIILSHGEDDAIYGTDGMLLPVNEILELFNNENCSQMIHKPKMFFLSACRGCKFREKMIAKILIFRKTHFIIR